MQRTSQWALRLLLFGAVACSQGAENIPRCQSTAIMFGTEEPAALPLSAGQQLAVVSIVYSSGDGCTGTFVTRGAIATSSHCILEGREPHVAIGNSLNEVFQLLQPIDAVTHPEFDLGLLFVDEEQVPNELVPIPMLAQSVDNKWLDSIVEIGGFGITENGSAFVKRFAATVVQEIDDASIVVSSDGANGACVGDSGGPLLGRDDAGTIRLVGVLTAGHPSCVARDRYVRADVARAWWDEHAAVEDLEDSGCHGLTTAGTCVRDLAMRCDSKDQVVVQRCEGDEQCGRAEGDEAFGCITKPSDVCDGLGSDRRCDGELLVACGSSGQEETECMRCGGACREHLPGRVASCVAAEP